MSRCLDPLKTFVQTPTHKGFGRLGVDSSIVFFPYQGFCHGFVLGLGIHSHIATARCRRCRSLNFHPEVLGVSRTYKTGYRLYTANMAYHFLRPNASSPCEHGRFFSSQSCDRFRGCTPPKFNIARDKNG